MRQFKRFGLLLLLLLAGLCHSGNAAPSPGLIHIRGVITAVSPDSIAVRTSSGPIIVKFPTGIGVAGLIPSSRSAVKPGSFLGIASVPNSSGSQSAKEVVVFPEAARGTGEGSYDWDLPISGAGHSRMTNGTVAGVSGGSGGKTHSKMTNGTVTITTTGSVTLTYKTPTSSGSQSIALPPGIPFVTFVPGSISLLKPEVHVFVVAKKLSDGSLVAVRVLAGKNGLIPPM